ncbi:VWA domain-containing protein [Methyloterricola oryzae]|uniref:VWA domain-containing protein n=1 Tax=Methyloterricola oryzae TaxID=1495050 RepID=UPI0005EB5A2A|nr:vWA domain-containing protein [Methyloterricola oryzae]
MRGVWLAILFLLVNAWGMMACANSKLDVVLLLDNSASMLTSDPDNLRLDAVRGFMALLREDDRLAVFTFGERVKPISDFVLLDAKTRLRLEARVVQEMTPSAAYTNLHAPLAQALDQLAGRRPDAVPMVVLFTDGRMDMGDVRTDERLTRELVEHVLPRYRAGGARIYGLAFSDGSDRGLLDTLALNTGGFSHSAQRPQDVWRAFGNLFENIKKPDRLPVRDGRFLVDASVKEFKLLSGSRGAESLVLRSPSGRSTVNPPAEHGNPVLTVRSPEAGEWQISNAAGDDTVVAESSIDLATDLPDYVAAGRLPRPLKLWAEEEGPAGALNLSRMSLHWWPEQDPQARRVVPLQRVGSQGPFTGQMPVLGLGTYSLELDAEGPSFRRSKRISLRVVSDSTPIPAVAAQVPTPRPSLSRPEPSPPVTPREAVQTDFFGLFRIEDQAAWTTLRSIFWTNLVLCVVIGVVLIWRRWRRTREGH